MVLKTFPLKADKFGFFRNAWCLKVFQKIGTRYPADNYMFKVDNRNTRTRCEGFSKLTIETLEADVKYVQG